jgi:hypothetical protein
MRKPLIINVVGIFDNTGNREKRGGSFYRQKKNSAPPTLTGDKGKKK